MKNLVWWIALAVFAGAALISGLMSAHQAQAPKGPESLGDYVIETCENGQSIVKSVHEAAVARGQKTVNQYSLSAGAAEQFNICLKKTPDPLTRDWSTFNYAFWLARSAPPNKNGVPVMQQAVGILGQLHDRTPYPVVKNGSGALQKGLEGELAQLKKFSASK